MLAALVKPVGRKGESNEINEGMAARVEKGILHAFRSEFPLPKARYACLECSLFLPNHQELEIGAQAERERKESRFGIAGLAAGTVVPAAGRGGQRMVLKKLLYQTG